jgi:hypothetical protein
MDNKITFQPHDPEDHACTSHQDGDWVVWRCPQCAGYERRLNLVTGELRTRRGGSDARHSGLSTKPQNMEALQDYRFLN